MRCASSSHDSNGAATTAGAATVQACKTTAEPLLLLQSAYSSFDAAQAASTISGAEDAVRTAVAEALGCREEAVDGAARWRPSSKLRRRPRRTCW
jgi:hypothetical protein